jgi:ATP-binding cassette subfamily B protein
VRPRHVTFSYRDRIALADISIVVEPGEQLAVIGPNGAGKSTLLAIMLGLYRPLHGSVLIDDVPLAELDLPSLRRQIGVALQDAALFPGRVRDNLILGRTDVAPGAVAEAAQIAEALSFIEELPDGFDTRIVDGTVGLSGGQRQQIAIARAVLGRPRLLLLDEPTANLAGEVSRLVMGNLCQLPWDPTVLVITHDVALASATRRVLRLEAGRLIDDGSFDRRWLAVRGTSVPQVSLRRLA